MTWNDYMTNLYNAVRSNPGLFREGGLYSGIEGHKRFAHECGTALNDFDKRSQHDNLASSYGGIYVRCVMFAAGVPLLLDTRAWLNEMVKGKGRAEHGTNNLYSQQV